jgi:hypothetical protein
VGRDDGARRMRWLSGSPLVALDDIGWIACPLCCPRSPPARSTRDALVEGTRVSSTLCSIQGAWRTSSSSLPSAVLSTRSANRMVARRRCSSGVAGVGTARLGAPGSVEPAGRASGGADAAAMADGGTGGLTVSGLPQAPQKRCPAAATAPQTGQVAGSGAPQCPQKRWWGGLGWPQVGQGAVMWAIACPLPPAVEDNRRSLDGGTGVSTAGRRQCPLWRR